MDPIPEYEVDKKTDRPDGEKERSYKKFLAVPTFPACLLFTLHFEQINTLSPEMNAILFFFDAKKLVIDFSKCLLTT